MVKWQDIEQECGGFREGFVRIFKRYEGQPTDERDGSNRAVRVTQASFARHVGIPEQTFRQWLALEVGTKQVVTSEDRERLDALPSAREQWLADAKEALDRPHPNERVGGAADGLQSFFTTHEAQKNIGDIARATQALYERLAGSALTGSRRDLLERWNEEVVPAASAVTEWLATGGVTDAALQALLDGES